MDTTILVDKQYDEGKKLIEQLDESGRKFPIAAWMNSEQNGWVLLFGVPNLRKIGTKDLFKRLHEIIVSNNIEISLSNITLVDSTSEICQKLRTIIHTGYQLGKIAFTGTIIDGKAFPDSIVYRVN